MCDGFKVRKTSQRKQGIVTDDEAELYREYVNEVARLCREHPLFRRTRLVRLARRQGSAYAIREAIDAHVQTPFVIIVPHDCVIARPVNLDAVATAMHKHPGQISYVKIVGRSTLNYAEAVQSQYGVKLQPLANMLPDGLTLLPMLRYMDNVAIVSVRYLKEVVYHPSSAVRRATFIEDTFGKQTQMHAWLQSEEYTAKLPPSNNGCFLLLDGSDEPMMRHLDGKTYLDPEQRADAGLPSYPKDWTKALQDDKDDGEAGAEKEVSADDLVPLRDALCWASMADGCHDATCTLLQPRCDGTAVCGRHATSVLQLWGRRKRPPCPGDCGKAHPSYGSLVAAICRVLPPGKRLHVHASTPPCLGGGGAAAGWWVTSPGGSLYVAPSTVTQDEADAALAAKEPMALRVAIDVGYDDVMSEGERKSLATQCGLCHSIASQAEHRPHVALAICCGTPSSAIGDEEVLRRDGSLASQQHENGSSSSLSLLYSAGIEQWHGLAWRQSADDNTPLSLLSLPNVGTSDLIYLSPEAPDVLTELHPSKVYVIGGLVDRHKIHGSSYRRASALGIQCARLPLVEHLPKEMKGRTNALDALNINSVCKLLVEWSKCRDWTRSITTAFEGSQRNCCPFASSGSIHPNGYWDGPKAAHQHQHDASLSEALLAFFTKEQASSVVDLGCGMGSYVRHFLKSGLNATGYDGNPSTPQLSKGACAVLDLSVIAEVEAPSDWVLALEVGEHLPKEHEANFVENCHRFNAKGMVLSWATKGQGGTGHVNEQDNEYVKAMVCKKGYVNDLDAECTLRKAAAFSYFKRTVMVFRKL